MEAGSDLELDDSHHFSVEDLNDRAFSEKKSPLKKPKPKILEIPTPKLKVPSKLKTNRNS
jgi:hypothetical protein